MSAISTLLVNCPVDQGALTSYWQDGKTILVESKSKERGTPVISNAAITIR